MFCTKPSFLAVISELNSPHLSYHTLRARNSGITLLFEEVLFSTYPETGLVDTVEMWTRNLKWFLPTRRRSCVIQGGSRVHFPLVFTPETDQLTDELGSDLPCVDWKTHPMPFSLSGWIEKNCSAPMRSNMVFDRSCEVC